MGTEYFRGKTRRDAIVEYISEYQQQQGYAPSISEITKAVGSVRSNVHHHLHVLQQEGRLTAKPGIARSWVVRHG